MTAPRPRPEILTIDAYVAGQSKVQGVNRIIKLSSNEGAFGPAPAAQEAYRRVAAEIHRYPDGGSVALREALGKRFGLDPERIVCGTGSDELIQHLCHIYGGPGTDIIMSMHGFSMYQISGTYAGSRVLKAPERNLTTDVDAILAAVTPDTRIVFVANPNNPTGSLLPQSEMERLRAGLPPEVLLAIDAAYAEYVTEPGYDPGVKLVDAGENTVMLRTFSKVYALGGLRVGWCYAPASVTDVLNRVRGVFNVNLGAQAAAIAALEEQGWIDCAIAHNTEFRAKLSSFLESVGIKVWPSHGNFILADFGTPARAEAADAFLRGRGIIVRGMAAYDLPHCLRITIGNGEECALVADALGSFMAGQRHG
ncbi:Histidinol-phosphate aminotransferase [Rhodovastum atsumiense]|uniref:Histidinol-phosphate aminotransferase n=1 Tax=Rhodovastum atsumiense TaxID=504468 RepID=A0A5M6IYB5_9PROT|nr:histidinol-phosphate transaminase [Rhodovastum atsumiense]KAA5613271.1 histidinol-phosphate transaminase [Rhodovastum atsumiense]CAH2600566.1 Histidinol-phosphate aminotransferase [Rhodovastum atsumiense]